MNTSRTRPTLARRLLIVVNLTLLIIFVAATYWEVRHISRTLVRQKYVDLENDAKTLLPAVQHSRRMDSAAPSIQRLINDACASVTDADSPEHLIAVEIGRARWSANPYPSSPDSLFEQLATIAAQPDHTGKLGSAEVIAARVQQDGVTIYVSESIAGIQGDIRTTLTAQLTALAALWLGVAVALNLAVRQFVSRPLSGMVATVRKIGDGDLAARMPLASTRELGLLSDEFDRMAEALEKADAERRMRMDKARRIQENLRPDLTAQGSIRFAFGSQPAAEVAGDYYDALPLSDGSILFCVADVTGHDVPAALGAAMLKALLLILVEQETDPQRLVERLNEAIGRVSLPEDFVTLALVRYDAATRTARVVSAGHEPSYLLRANGEMLTIAASGPPLGIHPLAPWTSETFATRPGDRLLILTDGLAETMSPTEECFGRDRIRQLFASSGQLPIQELPHQLLNAAAAHRGAQAQNDDDITILAIEF